MNFDEILIYLNPLLIIAALYFGYKNLRNTNELDKRNFDSLLYSILGVHSISLVILVYYFLKTDLRLAYVSDYSSDDLSIGYKLAGVWAGRDGTLLIWSWATIASIVSERKLANKEDSQKEITSLIACILLLALTIIQLYINPFERNEITPDIGTGLNPLLLSPYMIIHPPIVFLSYGMIVLLYSSGMAYLITKNKNWNDTIKRWGRASWIGMSLALVLGGYWAYLTLGWGGYWAWDPVETAGLLPWLAMTSLLHTSVMSRRKNNYVILGPLLAMLSFVLVLLESFVTRGGIWSSVHSFIVEDTGGAWSRLGYVLENDISVRGFFILMILSFVLTHEGKFPDRLVEKFESPPSLKSESVINKIELEHKELLKGRPIPELLESVNLIGNLEDLQSPVMGKLYEEKRLSESEKEKNLDNRK